MARARPESDGEWADEPLGDDPLGLEAVDEAIRLRELRERVDDLGPGSMFVDPECPPEVEGAFYDHILAFESAPVAAFFDRLVGAGVELPHPDAIEDGALAGKIMEIAHKLAEMGAFLTRTDHLSDRELYADLWHSVLRDEYQVMAPERFFWHLDILGGCSEEDIENSLRYYDSEESRRAWAEEWPEDVMPPHVDPPYDRDRHLPQPDWGDVPEDGDDGEEGDPAES